MDYVDVDVFYLIKYLTTSLLLLFFNAKVVYVLEFKNRLENRLVSVVTPGQFHCRQGVEGVVN